MSEPRRTKGEVVEAWYDGEWHRGEVKKVLRDGGCIVVVPGPFRSRFNRDVCEVEWRPKPEHIRTPAAL